jgi:hypothetical protein
MVGGSGRIVRATRVQPSVTSGMSRENGDSLQGSSCGGQGSFGNSTDIDLSLCCDFRLLNFSPSAKQPLTISFLILTIPYAAQGSGPSP